MITVEFISPDSDLPQSHGDTEFVLCVSVTLWLKIYLKYSFGGRHSLHPGINPRRHAQSARGRLENGFEDVMRIPPVQQLHVNVQPGMGDDRLPKLLDQVCVETPYAFLAHLNLVHKIRAPRQIDRHSHQG